MMSTTVTTMAPERNDLASRGRGMSVTTAVGPPTGVGGGSTISLLACLAFCLFASWFVHAYLDRAGQHLQSYMTIAYPQEVESLARMEWWQYLLPLQRCRGIWGTTGFLMVYGMECAFGVPATYHILQAVMVVVGFWVTWAVFRSQIFSFTFALCLGLGTFNYHVYSCPGSVIMAPLVTFLMLTGYCQYRLVLVEDSRAVRVWAPLCLLTIILTALCYEGWLDYVAYAWIAYPVLALHLKRQGEMTRGHRVLGILAMLTVVAVIYVVVKLVAGIGSLHPRGGEADLVVTYGIRHVYLIIEDMVSSFFTFFYTAVTTYIPPELFIFSQSTWRYGADKVVALQEGYHPTHAHLVHYNHVFLWRYYAGFALCGFIVLYGRILGLLRNSPNSYVVAAFLFLTATLVGSPTHLLIKWRPMHAAPFLGYQVYLAVIGWTLFGALLAKYVAEKWTRRWAATILLVLWLNVFYCALSRPSLMSHMSTESGLGPYPSPWRGLRELL